MHPSGYKENDMPAFEYDDQPKLGIPQSTGIPLAALITFSTAALIIVLAVLSRDRKVND